MTKTKTHLKWINEHDFYNMLKRLAKDAFDRQREGKYTDYTVPAFHFLKVNGRYYLRVDDNILGNPVLAPLKENIEVIRDDLWTVLILLDDRPALSIENKEEDNEETKA